MIVSLEQISLTNSRIRIALKQGDPKTIFDATKLLCKGDSQKANQIIDWFSGIAASCREKKRITLEISLMRMWQMGNLDIKEISEEGEPSFILTITGAEKIKTAPKEKWFEVLLWDEKKQLV